MLPEEFRRGCERTVCSHADALDRLIVNAHGAATLKMLHGAMGAAKEAGELLDHLEKHVFFDRPLDRVKLLDEGGDLLHYLAILFTAAGLRFEDAMASNLAKLRARYPEGFDGERSVTKDRAKEQRAAAGAPGGGPSCKASRTRSQVLEQQNSVFGCCDRNVDQQPCECLSLALPDELTQDGHGWAEPPYNEA
jgi:NTP pyrophosphatase (non-canonical NTP hydrolase)